MYIHDVTESWGSLLRESVKWGPGKWGSHLGQSIWGDKTNILRHGRMSELYLIKYKSLSLYIHWHCIVLVSIHWSPFLRQTAKWGRPFVRFGEDRLGKQWQGPIQRNDRLSELYSIECYIFSLTFNSFLILRVHSFASRPNGAAIWGSQFWDTITVGTSASALPLVIIVCNHRNITQSRFA